MDYRLDQWINHPAGSHSLLDAMMIHAASWGEAIFIALIAVWFLVGWIRGLPRDRQGALTALIGAGMALLVNQIILHLWARPRPFVAHPETVHLLLRHATDPSFPSDHASPAFAIAGVLVLFHRRLGVLALLVAAFMCYARVYVGDHYPGDVAAGAVIGIVVAVILAIWLDNAMVVLRRLVDRLIRLLRLPLPA